MKMERWDKLIVDIGDIEAEELEVMEEIIEVLDSKKKKLPTVRYIPKKKLMKEI